MMSNEVIEKILQYDNVRYCKMNGSIMIFSKYIEWVKAGESNSEVHIPFTDIKNQKISPEGKVKIQLQIVLFNTTSYIFHFANPDGQKIQKDERDKTKEVVTQQVLRSRRKQPDEMMEKKRILEENPHLKELYMSLVPTEILSADDFWKEIASKYKQALIPDLDVGISGAFLADIKPQTDGTNGRVMYNLTSEIMTAVFKTYPAVRRKHEEYVPHHMTESEFWTRFFQSHYYSTHSTSRSENVFSECVKYDDKEWSKDLNTVKSDPLYNLCDIYENKLLETDSEIQISRNKSSTNEIHATMIKRFNQHSQNILKAQDTLEKERSLEEPDEAKKKNKTKDGGHPLTNGCDHSSTKETSVGGSSKRKRFEEKLKYEDLEGPAGPSADALVIHQKSRYLNGPTTEGDVDFLITEDVRELPSLHHNLSCAVRSWKPDLHHSQSSSQAVDVLRIISGNSTEARNNSTDSTGDHLPREVQTELSKIYRSSGELLRHFWSCFPARTPQLQEKVHRMHATINRFHESSLLSFQNCCGKEFNRRRHLLEHLQQMFFIANSKYESWKARNG